MSRAAAAVVVAAVLIVSACGRGGSEPADTNEEPDTTAVTAPQSIGASHILISYAGAQSSSTQRTRDEALVLIQDLQSQIAAGTLSFEDAAMQYSDCPSGADGGALGVFGRGAMVPEFEDAAFALSVGEMSGVVETAFGYHLIKRTQ
jgi:parvulin-like peptidyl-prolyl isomerase